MFELKNIITAVIICIFSYLLGSINSAIIVSKLKFKKDIRKYGSGNGGLTNAYRTMGALPTIFVLLGDFSKGLIASILGNCFFGVTGALMAGIFVMLGHLFPVYFGFRGGKGVLTGVAVTLPISPWIFAILMSIFLVIAVLTKYVSLASILATAAFPLLLALFIPQSTPADIIMAIIMAGMIIIKHRSNIIRLINKNESKFKFHRERNGDETKQIR